MSDRPAAGSPSAIDLAYERTRFGGDEGFADWVRLVEHPLRSSLRRFARRVDVEAIVQESLLRMWVLASRLELEGRDASLRYALRLARNMALRETERLGRFEPLADDAAVESPATADPLPDPALRRAILACIEALPPRPRAALTARLAQRHVESDRAIAARLGVRVNTFLQNVVRARKALVACLASRGISLQEVLR